MKGVAPGWQWRRSGLAHEVFISHSVADKEAALAACALLEREGIRCWIAPRDVAPGAPWAAALVDAIRASRVLLLVLSSRSNDSEHVLREVAASADAKLPVLTFRIEDTQPSTELSYYIRRSHWLDATRPPLAAALPGLVDAVRRLLEGRASGARGASSGAGSADGPRRGPLVRLLGSRLGRNVAVGGLALAVMGGLAFAWARRSATLTIESEPADAVATVDGTRAGSTPLAVSLAAGSHGVRVSRAGFKEWAKVIDVVSGERTSFSLQLMVADARDAAAVNLLARSLGVQLEELALPPAERAGPEGAPLELIMPRGRVRIADLTTLVMDADPTRVEPSGVVALRRGEEALWDTPFDPRAAAYEVVVPDDARARLRVGDVLRWGWYPVGGLPVTVELQIVEDGTSPLFAEIDAHLGQQPPAVRHHLKLQGCADRQLYAAAFLEARRLAAADPLDLRARAMMERSLTLSGGGELRVTARVRSELRDAPDAERAWVFPSSLPGMDR